MHAPIRPLHNKWPRLLETHASRFFWEDPRRILDPSVSPEEFRKAMSAIHVGGTIKITGADRHPEPDSLLLNNVDLTDAVIVDIGASDGSTSVDLVRRLDHFKSFTISDLYLSITAVDSSRHTFFFDNDGRCILVIGNRLMGWPAQSKPIRLLYQFMINRAARTPIKTEVLLLNPTARALLSDDARVTYKAHDIFTEWNGERPTVIKVANLLRRLYFSDTDINRALESVFRSLQEGGYLLIVDNPRIPDMPPRGGLYQKAVTHFQPIAHTTNLPEIDDLIQATKFVG